MQTLVVQSHRSPLPTPWLAQCIASVKSWASHWHYDYEWLDDTLFATLSAPLRQRTHGQPIIAADLARLQLLERRLAAGYQRVVWVDADVLVFAPQALALPAGNHGFGREIWVQQHGKKLKTYRRLHNALMFFKHSEPVLPFYRQAAERLVLRHRPGPMAPQFIGPKLLSALHNLVDFQVIEQAAMLPPLVASDLLRGHGPALAAFNQACSAPPAAFNLCSSLGTEQAQLQLPMAGVIDLLLNQEGAALLASPGTSHT